MRTAGTTAAYHAVAAPLSSEGAALRLGRLAGFAAAGAAAGAGAAFAAGAAPHSAAGAAFAAGAAPHSAAGAAFAAGAGGGSGLAAVGLAASAGLVLAGFAGRASSLSFPVFTASVIPRHAMTLSHLDEAPRQRANSAVSAFVGGFAVAYAIHELFVSWGTQRAVMEHRAPMSIHPSEAMALGPKPPPPVLDDPPKGDEAALPAETGSSAPPPPPPPLYRDSSPLQPRPTKHRVAKKAPSHKTGRLLMP